MNATIKDGKFKSDEPWNYEDLLITLAGIIGTAAQYLINKQPTEQEQEECEAHLFDITNIVFSSALERAFPNQTLRPDLTEEAIMLAEDQLLKQKILNQQKENNNDTTSPNTTLS